MGVKHTKESLTNFKNNFSFYLVKIDLVDYVKSGNKQIHICIYCG